MVINPDSCLVLAQKKLFFFFGRRTQWHTASTKRGGYYHFANLCAHGSVTNYGVVDRDSLSLKMLRVGGSLIVIERQGSKGIGKKNVARLRLRL